MSGHSKWHNIKLRKQAQDKAKSKVYGKISREIITAAREGGSDPDGNARLRAAIEKARAAGMPQDNVKRAIQRGTGETEGVLYEPVTYEGYGAGGVAILVEGLTDNKNRVVSELRSMFSRNGAISARATASPGSSSGRGSCWSRGLRRPKRRCWRRRWRPGPRT